MSAVSTVLLLLFLNTLCGPLSRVVRVPLPLLQIGIGVLARLLGLQVRLDPDVFMLLFVAPLLFSDGFRMPMRELREMHGVILGLAVGLVLFATLGCGLFVHAVIPAIPLAACFALAAVLSPTDAVAVGSLMQGRPVPVRLLHVLSGEALLNDASGLVCFKFAAAAALSGGFSVLHAGGAFLLVSLGGAAVGAAAGLGLGLVERRLIRHGFDHGPTFAAASALLPFACYMAADALGASGILAAVAGGLALRRGGAYAAMRTESRLGTSAVWEMLTFALNGVVFLLLGLQLPFIVSRGIAMTEHVHVALWRLPLAVVEITLVLVALRLVWLHGTAMLLRLLNRPAQGRPPGARLLLAMAVAGVRGAITLAAILSLQDEFPNRNLLVTLATGVILCSLLLAAAFLPALLSGVAVEPGDTLAHEVDRARLLMASVAVDEVERELRHADDEHRSVLDGLLREMRGKRERLRLATEGGPDEDRDGKLSAFHRQRLELSIRLRVLRAERDKLGALTRAAEINTEIERELMRELDHQEEVVWATARNLPRSLPQDHRDHPDQAGRAGTLPADLPGA